MFRRPSSFMLPMSWKCLEHQCVVGCLSTDGSGIGSLYSSSMRGYRCFQRLYTYMCGFHKAVHASVAWHPSTYSLGYYTCKGKLQGVELGRRA